MAENNDILSLVLAEDVKSIDARQSRKYCLQVTHTETMWCAN